jgi:hypothetical protein
MRCFILYLPFKAANANVFSSQIKIERAIDAFVYFGNEQRTLIPIPYSKSQIRRFPLVLNEILKERRKEKELRARGGISSVCFLYAIVINGREKPR